MKPESEFELSPEESMELLKPIYSLADSGDEWHRALDNHVQIDLKIVLTIIYPSLYCQFEDNQLVGINGSCVDDLLRAERDEWQTHSDAALERRETVFLRHCYFCKSHLGRKPAVWLDPGISKLYG